MVNNILDYTQKKKIWTFFFHLEWIKKKMEEFESRFQPA